MYQPKTFFPCMLHSRLLFAVVFEARLALLKSGRETQEYIIIHYYSER